MTGQLANQILWVRENSAAAESDRPLPDLAIVDLATVVLERLHQGSKVDLLFTDVIMPGGMSGRGLAAAAQQLQPQLRVLYTSGYTENALLPQREQEPEIQLLAKPYQRAELARQVRQALSKG